METIKTFVPLVVGSYGLTLSSYLLYQNKKKESWKEIDGYVDNVTLKYSKNFLQGAFHLNIKYFFYINKKKIENCKEYKIYVHLGNQEGQQVQTNEYTRNIFEQVSREKNIKICYNPDDVEQSDPLIYISENDIIAREKLANRVKNKLLRIKTSADKLLRLRESVERKDDSSEGFSNSSPSNQTDKMKGKETSPTVVSPCDAETDDEGKSSGHAKPSQLAKKKINAYDINNLFPWYMFSCSLFLFLSFFLKKRIRFVRRSILEQQQQKKKIV
ncbi:conserved Plasmodium protein, unknown function [Plasmodium knowlesi strain H]|uniref:Transmembrane protein n=3 Tax=Plasmodium knowlesi TaxID=5850 RepID=A0A1A7VR04_PLAKH|nr:conserved Plasmodium protein, unknown function [Plasmodium knowlesi strain H]OTN67355.1 Uncharacterized protein PKNOH_S06411300 [Plasmodium knowlesi]CAA9987388.1 conserved Plasmodium protein, unknown function [Plasmodium knowlesi strain H]SBO23315.1 conserved Plasmodium protein, unknown function [Plasmodium knowlesi strain H]SBO24381.1 conserved Plasmodium protein, unknown function [Plasmodium knowlesi strain H]VVS76862.1 conserved Plasmodium protein, unknown function [Plasmodium knowlesi s